MYNTNINSNKVYSCALEKEITKEFFWNKNQNKITKKFVDKRDEKSNTIFLPLENYNVGNNLLVNDFNKNIINNKTNNIFFRNKMPFLSINYNSVRNISKNNYDNNKNLTEYNSLSIKNKNIYLRNIFKKKSEQINKKTFSIETKKYLLMEAPRKKNENFILKIIYNPYKFYNIFKNNHHNSLKIGDNNKNEYKKNAILEKYNAVKKNKTFIVGRNNNNLSKNKKYSKSLKIKNIKLDIIHSNDKPKMRISKQLILNLHPIDLTVFFKYN